MRRTTRVLTVLAAATAVTLAGCSSSGGRSADQASTQGAGKASTPTMTVSFITHSPTGDTFWDIVRRGAEVAAAKDNVQLEYSGDVDPTRQAQLIQAAIDKKVDAIAVTDPNTGALGPTIQRIKQAGIPFVMLNAGEADAFRLGALGFFGQSETDAGFAAGQRLAKDGAKHVLCVIHSQGQTQLEARCDGIAKGLGTAGKVDRAYVKGEDPSDVSTKINAALTQDPSLDWVVTLAATYALNAVQSLPAGSTAKIATFDTNAELVTAIKDGKVAWAIDQQPYLQGYLAVDSLWLYKTNGNTIGGGRPTATGPAFIDKSNVDAVAKFAANGTR
ncbi:sugar ABC transporter substrate-binding protein [Intrasporangium sp.]|uniref:sugar ABC transporter substrate-binding protein n=1 Tax=Intrasporangium sp. TaxID=1925024 RepID=UPI0032215E70